MQVWQGAWGLLSCSTASAWLGVQVGAWRNQGYDGAGHVLQGCGPAFGACDGKGANTRTLGVGAIRKIWGRIDSAMEELRRGRCAMAREHQDEQRPSLAAEYRSSRSGIVVPGVVHAGLDPHWSGANASQQLSRPAPDVRIARAQQLSHGPTASRILDGTSAPVAGPDVADGRRTWRPLIVHARDGIPARSSARPGPIFTGANWRTSPAPATLTLACC
jgi:hypothetical protein